MRSAETPKSGVLVLRRTQHALLSFEDVARAARLHVELVDKLISSGVIDPEPESAPALLLPFSAIDRVRGVMRLRRDLR